MFERSRDPELVGLVDINITGSNQNLVMNLISGGSCVAYLLLLVSTDTQPLQSPRILLTVYAALQVICVLCQFGFYHNIPDEGERTVSISVLMCVITELSPST